MEFIDVFAQELTSLVRGNTYILVDEGRIQEEEQVSNSKLIMFDKSWNEWVNKEFITSLKAKGKLPNNLTLAQEQKVYMHSLTYY